MDKFGQRLSRKEAHGTWTLRSKEILPSRLSVDVSVLISLWDFPFARQAAVTLLLFVPPILVVVMRKEVAMPISAHAYLLTMMVLKTTS